MLIHLTSWRTVLDILVMAAGLFFLYRTLIRLGTWKIFTGILVAALFFAVASFLNLKGVEWIYRNVSQVAVISLIVLFQPELRKVFERAASIRQNRGEPKDEQFFHMIADAMWRMSSSATGAIIVIPGRENIGQWISGGFRLESQPSLPLTLSIFDPNSPGHDGALIVKNGKFSQFGVRLPVSQSGRLSDDYGTRHQAAMGLSEKSDALVLVVSEERRRVSVFKNGEMTAMPSETAVFEALMSHCRDAGLFKQFFDGKLPYRTLGLEAAGSLATAVVLWVAIIAGQGEMIEKVVTVPVEYTATAENVVMTGDKAKEVRLHLAGSKSDLDAVSPAAMGVKIDLSKAVAGKQTVLISKENIRIPRGVRLLDVDPSDIEINISRLAEAVLPVSAQLVGSLPRGLHLVSVTVTPDRLAVLVPSGESDRHFGSLITTPVYLDGIRENTTLFCKVISPPAVQPVDKRWPDVEISLKVTSDPPLSE